MLEVNLIDFFSLDRFFQSKIISTTGFSSTSFDNFAPLITTLDLDNFISSPISTFGRFLNIFALKISSFFLSFSFKLSLTLSLVDSFIVSLFAFPESFLHDVKRSNEKIIIILYAIFIILPYNYILP